MKKDSKKKDEEGFKEEGYRKTKTDKERRTNREVKNSCGETSSIVTISLYCFRTLGFFTMIGGKRGSWRKSAIRSMRAFRSQRSQYATNRCRASPLFASAVCPLNESEILTFSETAPAPAPAPAPSPRSMFSRISFSASTPGFISRESM